MSGLGLSIRLIAGALLIVGLITITDAFEAIAGEVNDPLDGAPRETEALDWIQDLHETPLDETARVRSGPTP